MDPDANLTEQLTLVAAISSAWDECADDGTLSPAQLERVANDALRLAELVDSLHGWLSRGGCLPRHWNRSTIR